MITLHRLGHEAEPFQLNPDLIITVEANPDTVITLTNGTKIVVAEPPERVAREVKACRVEILTEALRGRREERGGSSGVSARRASHGILTTLEPVEEVSAPPSDPAASAR
jgi:flagellar protein FlbD